VPFRALQANHGFPGCEVPCSRPCALFMGNNTNCSSIMSLAEAPCAQGRAPMERGLPGSPSLVPCILDACQWWVEGLSRHLRGLQALARLKTPAMSSADCDAALRSTKRRLESWRAFGKSGKELTKPRSQAITSIYWRNLC